MEKRGEMNKYGKEKRKRCDKIKQNEKTNHRNIWENNKNIPELSGS